METTGKSRRRRIARPPGSLPAPEQEQEAEFPAQVYLLRRGSPLSIPRGEIDPARAAWVDLCWTNAAAAREQLLHAKQAYWKGRIGYLEHMRDEELRRWEQEIAKARLQLQAIEMEVNANHD